MKAELLRRWQQLAGRFDALEARRRYAWFAAATLAAALLLHELLLQPALEAERAAQLRSAAVRGETETLAEQKRMLEALRNRDPDDELRRRIDDLRTGLGVSEAELQALQGQLIAPARMAGMLREVLAHNRSLVLLEMKSVAPTVLTIDAARPQGKTGEAEGPKIYRHGLELTVKGGYLELLGYLKALERMPYRMFWREAEIASENHPEIVMRITVHTISLDKAYISL